MSFKKSWILVLIIHTYLIAYTPPSEAVSRLKKYRGYSELTKAMGSMDKDLFTYNLSTWQIDHGGFYKAFASKYTNPWNGSDAKSDIIKNGKALGTIDNDATIQEMRLLAEQYKTTKNATYKAKFKETFQKALAFLLDSQRSKGGFPQMHPKRGNYSDQITFNDDAMIRAMLLLQDILEANPPFDSDIVQSNHIASIQNSLNKAVDFILKSQIVNQGELTVWCAQHDTNSYAPVEARSYELPSKSGLESAGIVWFLMNWKDQNAAVQKAVKGAIQWYKKNRVPDLKYSSGNFVSSSGASMWYRFYEVDKDQYFFCDREGVSSKTTDITKLSEDRRYGYQWAGDYGSLLLAAEASYLKAIENIQIESPTDSSTHPEPTETVSAFDSCEDQKCKSILEGENFCYVDGVFENKNQGFSGEGYVNPDNEIHTQLQYKLESKNSQDYTIYIRYANGGESSRNARLSTKQNHSVDIDFAPTTTWELWKTISLTMFFEKGVHTITFEALTNDGLPNIDWIAFNNESLMESSCESTNVLVNTPKNSALKATIKDQFLHLENTNHQATTIKVMDLHGKTIKKIHTTQSTIDLSLLKPGLYLFEILETEKKHYFKLPLF